MKGRGLPAHEAVAGRPSIRAGASEEADGQIETTTSESERSGWRLRLERLRLRFRDPGLESAYRADRFRHDLGNIRFAFLAGIFLWVTWGLLLRPYMLALSDQRLDMVMRFGVFIPMLIVGLGLTYTRFFGRVWEWASVAIAAATILVWVFYVSRISTLPLEYGYVGVILITAFTYTLLQLRFVLVMLVTVIGIAAVPPVRPHRPVHRAREPGADDALPGLVRLAGGDGCLSDGTPHARPVPPRTPARPGTGAVRRAAAQHAARGHRRAAQDLRRRTDRPELRSGQRVLRRRGRIHGTGRTVLPGGVRRCPG